MKLFMQIITDNNNKNNNRANKNLCWIYVYLSFVDFY